jgi:hypothetical protein
MEINSALSAWICTPVGAWDAFKGHFKLDMEILYCYIWRINKKCHRLQVGQFTKCKDWEVFTAKKQLQMYWTDYDFPFPILKVKGLHSLSKSEGVYKDDLLGLQKEVSTCYLFIYLFKAALTVKLAGNLPMTSFVSFWNPRPHQTRKS